MVLKVDQFRIHHSFKKTLLAFTKNPNCEIRIDSAFSTVIKNCALRPSKKVQSGDTPLEDPPGTWILPEMQTTYCEAHAQGLAHSVETWVGGVLVGGLYCVSIGKAVFGESMFSLQKDVSKIALAALVAFCRANGIVMIDCQQNTGHLASLGAREIPRATFLDSIKISQDEPAPDWQFQTDFWQKLFT